MGEWIFYAPREEQKQPDFKANSKVRAFTIFLGGAAGILLGLYQLFHEKWMGTIVIILTLVIMLLSIIAGLIIGSKEKHRNEKHSSIKKKSLRNDESISLEFSITEIRIAALRFPIIFGCYVLLPLGVLGEIFYSVTQMHSIRFDNSIIEILYYTVAFIMGPCCWMLNKMLPKMKFSYSNEIFTKEKNGKIEAFSVAAIAHVKLENTAMPDYILFYLQGRKKPIRISMKGFRIDDRFDIPRKVSYITKIRLTQTEKKILEDFECS